VPGGAGRDPQPASAAVPICSESDASLSPDAAWFRTTDPSSCVRAWPGSRHGPCHLSLQQSPSGATMPYVPVPRTRKDSGATHIRPQGPFWRPRWVLPRFWSWPSSARQAPSKLIIIGLQSDDMAERSQLRAALTRCVPSSGRSENYRQPTRMHGRRSSRRNGLGPALPYVRADCRRAGTWLDFHTRLTIVRALAS
jgi:hypothetical protein